MPRIEKLKYFLIGFRSLHRYTVMQNGMELNRIAGELLRNTHSIEKGLSINNPRLGFGHEKQRKMMVEIEQLQNSQSPYHIEVCRMAVDALSEYLFFHKNNGYSDDFCNDLEKFLKSQDVYSATVKMGGTQTIRKEDLIFDIPQIEKFFQSRHSIRDFQESELDDEMLRKALLLAQSAPSACNRQGVRAYVLDQKKSNYLAGQLSGIGGFEDAVGRYILITAKTSVYRFEELNQYIVSASMYAAYLTLSLHLYGMGACIVQRPVVWTKEWDVNCNMFGIDKDEQIICTLAVGNLKEECTVPLSHRLQNETMITFL